MHRTFTAIITNRGAKSNTYKFALAKFLLNSCHRLHPDDAQRMIHSRQNLVLDYDEIAAEFLKYYWHQVCKYRIRQNYDESRPPYVVSTIRRVFGEKYIAKRFEDMPRLKIEMAQKEIRSRVFGRSKDKHHVISRFHNVRGGAGSSDDQLFYRYDRQEGRLEIKPRALEFFYENYTCLSKMLLLEWTKFLENINSVPRLIDKIESYETKRTSLKKYVKIFKDFRSCFYCNTSLDVVETHVDHFIPWSYIFEDEAWNLVMACQKCNNRKRDSLARSYFLEDLIARNGKYQGMIKELKRSLIPITTKRGWEHEMTHYYRSCKEHGFRPIKLP